MTTSKDEPQIVAQGFDAVPFRKCSECSFEKLGQLEQLLAEELQAAYASNDASLVIFGSLARREWTSGSDLDWTYLIDGGANSDHLVIAQKIKAAFKKGKLQEPGATETFGTLAFSHNIIHQIGGRDDTNKNTTQRILLVLESRPIGQRTEAYERVIRGVINRYIEEDNHLLTADSKRFRVPRFLLNDIVRFWRTMAVDFASKQRDRGGEGWGLRNAKLRMSRKLIFASGLLICFGANLDPDLTAKISTGTNDIELRPVLVNYIRQRVEMTPLDVVAKSAETFGFAASITKQLFGAYSEFLEILNEQESRTALSVLRATDSRTDATFERIRRMSQTFDHALNQIFFENELIAPLTRKYGIF